eukprot:9393845-Pyramimonas_sp.AAC.1
MLANVVSKTIMFLQSIRWNLDGAIHVVQSSNANPRRKQSEEQSKAKQCKAKQCKAMQCNAMQCSAMQYKRAAVTGTAGGGVTLPDV